jgi:hypothetical protein
MIIIPICVHIYIYMYTSTCYLFRSLSIYIYISINITVDRIALCLLVYARISARRCRPKTSSRRCLALDCRIFSLRLDIGSPMSIERCWLAMCVGTWRGLRQGTKERERYTWGGTDCDNTRSELLILKYSRAYMYKYIYMYFDEMLIH